MAARAKKATSKPTSKKASGKKVVTKKGHRNRRIKTTKGVKRRVKGLKAPPQRKHRRGKKSTAAQKLKAKKARLRLAKLETPADKKFAKGRGKHLRDLRAKRKGKKVGGKRKTVVAGKGKKGHKLSMVGIRRGLRKAGASVSKHAGAASAAIMARIRQVLKAISDLKARMATAVSEKIKAHYAKKVEKLTEQLTKLKADLAAGKATRDQVSSVSKKLGKARVGAGTRRSAKTRLADMATAKEAKAAAVGM